MMLDPKATFDDLIARLSPDAQTRDDVLGNRIYKQLSSAVAGSQEFTAVAKLYDLHREGGFDVLVLDTPPSRNALDFLDAPDRLTDFFEGRALKVLLVPTGIAARVMARGTSVVFAILKRLTGVDLMDDIAVFFRALGGLMDGFKERAAGVKALLADDATTFLIVTSPEREPVAEAIFFRGKLREAGMAFGGLIVNRVNVADDGRPGRRARPSCAQRASTTPLAAKVAQSAADQQRLAARDAAADRAPEGRARRARPDRRPAPGRRGAGHRRPARAARRPDVVAAEVSFEIDAQQVLPRSRRQHRPPRGPAAGLTGGTFRRRRRPRRAAGRRPRAGRSPGARRARRAAARAGAR